MSVLFEFFSFKQKTRRENPAVSSFVWEIKNKLIQTHRHSQTNHATGEIEMERMKGKSAQGVAIHIEEHTHDGLTEKGRGREKERETQTIDIHECNSFDGQTVKKKRQQRKHARLGQFRECG